jgi:hypothetical protein
VTAEQVPHFRKLEGHHISIALVDGSRLDDCQLISVSRHRNGTVWVYLNGDDCFIPIGDVIDFWEAA